MFTNSLYPILENNACVVVKNKHNNYQVFSYHKDTDGDFRLSDWCASIEEAKQLIGYYCGWSKENLNKVAEEDNWEIVEIYRDPMPQLKTGQKVEILDSIKNTDDWTYCAKDFPDMTGEIVGIRNNIISGICYGVKGKNNTLVIGAEYLIPLVEEEEIKIVTMAEVCEKFGYNVQIKKE